MNLQEARQRLPELAGLNDETALGVINESYYPNMDRAELAGRLGYTPSPPAVEPAGVVRGTADIGLSLGQGAVGAFKGISDIAGAENQVSQGLGAAGTFLGDLKSDQSKATMGASMARGCASC